MDSSKEDLIKAAVAAATATAEQVLKSMSAQPANITINQTYSGQVAQLGLSSVTSLAGAGPGMFGGMFAMQQPSSDSKKK
jgi:fructose-1-phosphate kinase PfkB-like protein